MKILITGFEPFAREPVNPATEAVERMQAPEGVELIKMPELPTMYGIHELVISWIRKHKPQAVLCVGQAGGRRAVTVERIAINAEDCSLEDNAGFVHQDEEGIPGGPAAFFATLPVKKIVSGIRAAGIPAELSNTAGTFVCNSLFYHVLAFCQSEAPEIQVGFIHLPFLPSQTESRPGYPSMALADMVTALEAAVQVLADAGT